MLSSRGSSQPRDRSCLLRLLHHFFQNFPQLVIILTVKGFSIVNEAEVDVFLEFPCFLLDPANVGNLIFGSSACNVGELSLIPG